MAHPISLFSSTRSAPLPKGMTLTPSLPIGTPAAKSFISAYPMLEERIFLLTHALRIPVPLMQSNTPRRVMSASWFTWANVFTLLFLS